MNRIKEFYKIITKSEMMILPGNLAFSMVLSLVPLLTLIGFIASLFSISTSTMTNLFKDAIPTSVLNMLLPFLNGDGINASNLLTMIVGFFVASTGATSIIVTSNYLFAINSNSYIKRRLKAAILTITMILLMLFVTFFLAFGSAILRTLLDSIFISVTADKIYAIFLILKWPIALLIIYMLVKLIYTIAPDEAIGSKYMTKGAIITTVGWSVVTIIYSYYITNIAYYNEVYGNLANIIILIVWIYILAYIFVIGIAYNKHNYDLINKDKKIKHTN